MRRVWPHGRSGSDALPAGAREASTGEARPAGASWPGTFVPVRSWRTALVSAVAVVGLTGALVACSTTDTPATPTDPVLAEGQQIFSRNCASCHGSAGQGGGIGPRLAGRVTQDFPDIAVQEQFIAKGKSSMPSFEKTLTPEQIEAVARYTRESL